MVRLRVPGSSPLARGLLDEGRADLGGGGIIPARAGFTSPAAAQTPGTRDHPRSRGVYGDNEDDGSIDAGSSPLARGLR